VCPSDGPVFPRRRGRFRFAPHRPAVRVDGSQRALDRTRKASAARHTGSPLPSAPCTSAAQATTRLMEDFTRDVAYPSAGPRRSSAGPVICWAGHLLGRSSAGSAAALRSGPHRSHRSPVTGVALRPTGELGGSPSIKATVWLLPHPRLGDGKWGEAARSISSRRARQNG
jgi:hypothetical protein